MESMLTPIKRAKAKPVTTYKKIQIFKHEIIESWPDVTKRPFHTVTTFLIIRAAHCAPISNNKKGGKKTNISAGLLYTEMETYWGDL